MRPLGRSEIPKFTRARVVGGFIFVACLTGQFWSAPESRAKVVFEKYSAYHHILVTEEWGMRVLSFDSSQQTQMSVSDPLQGHFEYIDYFHMAWVWNHDMKKVLMLGLGGGSVQRAYQHYYTNTLIDTVELDPSVAEVARVYFEVDETPNHKIHVQDGRVFLSRSTLKYDAIITDAYTTSRYGSSVPPQLATKEFFELASAHLTTNGVLAYNVIGTLRSTRADMLGAIYRTMKQVFPQVYTFPAGGSMNVVLIGTKSPELYDYARFQREGTAVMRSGVVRLPAFSIRLRSFQPAAPGSANRSPVLTDDYAPVESLMRNTDPASWSRAQQANK